MKKTAIALTLTASGLLLMASRATERAQVEAGEGGAAYGADNLIDTLETLMHRTTQATTTSNTPANVAAGNIAAFLRVIRQAEGTENTADPYRVCYAYRHTINDLREHPTVTGEWRGERLSDAMCANAGFGPGCVSTAAGAYQIIRPTWVRVRDKLGLRDFRSASQDAAAIELIRARGALEDVKAGRIVQALDKCRHEWASLPGNYAKQGQRTMGQLLAWYQQNGGYTA